MDLIAGVIGGFFLGLSLSQLSPAVINGYHVQEPLEARDILTVGVGCQLDDLTTPHGIGSQLSIHSAGDVGIPLDLGDEAYLLLVQHLEVGSLSVSFVEEVDTVWVRVQEAFHFINRLQQHLGPCTMSVAFHGVEMREGYKVVESPEFEITTAPVEHFVPTIAVKVVSKETGRAIVYSSDTEPCEALV